MLLSVEFELNGLMGQIQRTVLTVFIQFIQNILIDGSVAIGAADAGIYVGQSAKLSFVILAQNTTSLALK